MNHRVRIPFVAGTPSLCRRVSVMKCSQCDTFVPDTELFCPDCGAATIPQASRTELQSRLDKRDASTNRWAYRLTVWGFLGGIPLSLLAIGLAFSVRPDVLGPLACFTLLFAPLVTGLVGGSIGTLLDLFVRK
jgi:hypothetical protein